MDASFLLGLHAELVKDGRPIVLLEHGITATVGFLTMLFPAKPGSSGTLPVTRNSLTPDILVLERLAQSTTPVFEFMPDGTTRAIPKDAMDKRISISILDIKHANDEKVNKKHFIEILYYAWNLSWFLKENNLDSKFFVRGDANGIIRVTPRPSLSRPRRSPMREPEPCW